MKRRLGIAAAVLLVGGFLGGIALAGSGIDKPMVIKLFATACGEPHTHCKFAPLQGYGGHQAAEVGLFNVPVTDEDGNVVGRNHASCTSGTHTGNVCTLIEVIHHGPSTELGTVTATGLFSPPDVGDPPRVFAVTGGSGAYQNVRGYLTFGFDGTSFPITLYLIP